MREVTIERNTNETQIELTLNLDGAGRYQVDTGCGFLNHMLELFARHGRFDLVLTCHGDVEVDYHHTTEDVGIALGQAFAEALGDMRGIHRYGSFYLPMDEALILCAVDISGRCTLNWDIRCQTEKVGDFDVECAKEFWLGFARSVPHILSLRLVIVAIALNILDEIMKLIIIQKSFNITCLTIAYNIQVIIYFQLFHCFADVRVKHPAMPAEIIILQPATQIKEFFSLHDFQFRE